jgi:hypothetical protein
MKSKLAPPFLKLVPRPSRRRPDPGATNERFSPPAGVCQRRSARSALEAGGCRADAMRKVDFHLALTRMMDRPVPAGSGACSTKESTPRSADGIMRWLN